MPTHAKVAAVEELKTRFNGVKTVVLFFEKGAPTRQVWYYQLDPGRSLGRFHPSGAVIRPAIDVRRDHRD